MVLQSYESDAVYTDREKELMNIVAGQVAIFMQRKLSQMHLEKQIAERTRVLRQTNQALAKKIDETRRSEKLQKVLYELSQLANSDKPENEIYPAIHRSISQLLYAENFYIALVNEKQQCFDLVYFVDIKNKTRVLNESQRHLPMQSKTLTRLVFERGKTLLYTAAEIEYLARNHVVENIAPTAASWLGTPLFDGDRIIGVIVVQSYSLSIQYHSWHRELMQFVSTQITVTLQRNRRNQMLKQKVAERTIELEKEIRQRELATRTQKILYQIAELASGTSSLSELYKGIHEAIEKLVVAKNFYIVLSDEKKTSLNFVYFVDQKDEVTLEQIQPISLQPQVDSLTGWVFQQGKSIILDSKEIQRLGQKHNLNLAGPSCHSWIGVPIRVDENDFGLMVLQSYDAEHTYTQRDKELLEYVSRHIGTAINRARASEELKRQVEQATSKLRAANKSLKEQIKQRERSEKLKDALYRISEAPHICSSLEELFNSVHGILSELMYANNLYIVRINNQEKRFEFEYVKDEVDSLLPSSVPFGKSLLDYVVRQKNIVQLKPKDIAKLEKQNKIIHTGTYSIDWIGVPLVIDGDLLGLLVIQSYDESHTYGEAELEILEFVSQQIAEAIYRHQQAIELKKANDELIEKSAKAEAANRAKSQFLATISHEIRTPMNGVLGMLSLLKDTELDLRQNDYINKIEHSANALLRLINDVLDFSKIEEGKLEIESIEFSLVEVLNNCSKIVCN